MNYFKSLKTSERISLSFSIFGFISLLIFLILINITYFFIWYGDQKEKSFSSMNETYLGYLTSEWKMEDVEVFKQYLLSKDTIIIPKEGDLICSEWVSKKVHEDVENVKDQYLYKDGETVYFIYTKYFEHIGEVKVFFDTTPYINSQLIIMKTGIVFILLVFFLQFFAGKFISRKLLKDLKNISEKLKTVDIHSENKYVTCNMPEDDEIRILADALNSSYDTIESQTQKLKQFLTDVSHEFKTPLMGMSSELDVLMKKKEKSSLQHEDTERFFMNTRVNIRKLNSLLETLFFLSRIEENSWCLVKQKLFLREYVEKKLAETSQNFPHKHISCDLDIEKDIVYEVEENTFSILLDNIFSNAIKFSPKKVHLIIQADTNSFSIEDNGPGIDTHQSEKIWDKFYRKDTKIEWFWIGLYLVKRIVNIYNWKITLSSKKWRWAKFTVYL